MERVRKFVKHWSVFIFRFGIGIAFFVIGWFAANGNLSGERYQTILFMERNNAKMNEWEIKLTPEDAELLQEHLFGKWRFKGLEETVDTGFSEQGVKEMQDIEIIFSEDSVQMDGYNQHTFSDSKDMFTYLDRGGGKRISQPVYHVIRKENKERLPKMNRVRWWWDHEQAFPEKSEMIYVECDLGMHSSYWRVPEGYPGDEVCIDPEDTDTIYLRFSGLWEMERVE